jgi:DNA-binding HxlR family transcriptional regulator
VLYDGLAVPNPHSPLAEAVARVGDRWTLLVIDALLDGPRRFGELEQAVAGIAPNTLSQRLRELEAEGLAIGRPYQDRPRRVEYELTAEGHDLAGALRMLAEWATRHSPNSAGTAADHREDDTADVDFV